TRLAPCGSSPPSTNSNTWLSRLACSILMINKLDKEPFQGPSDRHDRNDLHSEFVKCRQKIVELSYVPRFESQTIIRPDTRADQRLCHRAHAPIDRQNAHDVFAGTLRELLETGCANNDPFVQNRDLVANQFNFGEEMRVEKNGLSFGAKGDQQIPDIDASKWVQPICGLIE